MITELKNKLEALKARQSLPTVAQEIFIVENAIKDAEKKASKEFEAKAEKERLKLKQEMVHETFLTARCPKCKAQVEMSVSQEIVANSVRQCVVCGTCSNPKCAITPDCSSNGDLSRTMLFAILPIIQAGHYRGVMR